MEIADGWWMVDDEYDDEVDDEFVGIWLFLLTMPICYDCPIVVSVISHVVLCVLCYVLVVFIHKTKTKQLKKAKSRNLENFVFIPLPLLFRIIDKIINFAIKA